MTTSFLRRRTVTLFLLTLFIGVALIGGMGALTHPAYAQDGGQNGPTGLAYRGKTLFVQRCVQCHGEQGKGDGSLAAQIPGPLPDFTAPDFAADMSPQDIFDIITEGRMDKMMPPWGTQLSEEERWDATAYVWSLHLQPTKMDQAVQLYEQKCSRCHGSSGAGAQDNTPNLNDSQWLAATDAQIISAFSSGSHPDVGTLSADEQRLAALASRRFSLGFDQSQVTVEGLGDVAAAVSNGTTGEQLANHPVQLLIFEQQQFVETRDGQTDEQGRAQFTGLPTAPTWAYALQTTFDGLTYHSDIGQFTPDSNKINLNVSVFDPGGKKDAVSIDRSHWLVDISQPGFVDMGEVYSFLNSADRVYGGETLPGQDKPRVLEIPLPAAAVHISVEGETLGERFLLEGTTLIDTQPLPPGDTQIFVRYTLPVKNGSVTLSHPFLYPTKMLNLLAPDIGVTIAAPDWQQDDPIQTQSGDFLNYSIFDLPAGATPAATIEGIDESLLTADAAQEPQQTIDKDAAPGISGLSYFNWIVGILGALVLGGGVFIGWKKHVQMQAEAPAMRDEQKQALIAQMAALDDAFETDEIDDGDYYEQRNTLKLQLVALMREEQEDATAHETGNISETPKIHPEEDVEINVEQENHG